MMTHCHIKRELRTVHLAAVDVQDSLYQVSWGPPPSGLADSLRVAGLINPPTLQRRADGTWRVVAGFRRCVLLKELGTERIEAWCVGEEESAPALFVWAVCDTLGARPLNVVEMATALAKLHAQFYLSEEEIAQHYMPLLGLEGNPVLLRRYLAMARLRDPMRQWLAEDRLSQEVALRLAEMPPAEAHAVFGVVAKLRLGKNEQRLLLRLLDDLARSRGATFAKVLACRELEEILARAGLTRTQKAKLLFTWLHQARFPHLAAAQERAERLVKMMNLPPCVRLRPPKNFEGEEWQCSLQFSSVEELREAAHRLQEVAKGAEPQELLRLP